MKRFLQNWRESTFRRMKLTVWELERCKSRELTRGLLPSGVELQLVFIDNLPLLKETQRSEASSVRPTKNPAEDLTVWRMIISVAEQKLITAFCCYICADRRRREWRVIVCRSGNVRLITATYLELLLLFVWRSALIGWWKPLWVWWFTFLSPVFLHCGVTAPLS